MSNTDSESQSVSYTGRVKWFNNKAGFGFVTCLDGDRKEEDVFVHHSGVTVVSEQYKYLVQGEYVNFKVKSTDNDEHPYQAYEVTGVLGGKLMCETRNEIRQTTAAYNESKRNNSEGSKLNRRGGKRDSQSSNEKWVIENKQNNASSSQ